MFKIHEGEAKIKEIMEDSSEVEVNNDYERDSSGEEDSGGEKRDSSTEEYNKETTQDSN